MFDTTPLAFNAAMFVMFADVPRAVTFAIALATVFMSLPELVATAFVIDPKSSCAVISPATILILAWLAAEGAVD